MRHVTHVNGQWLTLESFAEYRLFYRAPLQKRPIILRSLLIVATSYAYTHTQTHKGTHKHAQYTRTHTCTHTHTHTHKHARACARARAHTNTRPHPHLQGPSRFHRYCFYVRHDSFVHMCVFVHICNVSGLACMSSVSVQYVYILYGCLSLFKKSPKFLNPFQRSLISMGVSTCSFVFPAQLIMDESAK